MTESPWSLVLASASPRRRSLLALAGFDFEVIAPDVDESPEPGESPGEMVHRLALAKAVTVSATNPAGYVLGCDTVVVLDEPDGAEVLGKPRDVGDAGTMLLRLAGRSHRVLTGMAIVLDEEPVDHGIAESVVTMRAISADEANAYAATGESLDKAGGYALQGAAAGFVTEVDGTRSNVIGLPLGLVVPALERIGVPRRQIPTIPDLERR